MQRVCSQLHVRPERPERPDEYVARHAAVWPEMLREIFNLEAQLAES
jgi:L-rhamnose mutarotase